MKTSSAKAKGRVACRLVQELLYKSAPELQPGDIEITSSGATGEDLRLSPAARAVYPFAIEVKNQESIQIWAALEQAKSHVKGSEIPVLFFRRNRSELFACLSAEAFIKLVRRG
jgi:hypothetical protein